MSLVLGLGAACASSPVAEPVTTPAAAVIPALQTGELRTFVFRDWAGPAIPVWTYRPKAAGADAPVLLVFHGVGRDADRYLREWIPVAEAFGAVVACPEFSTANFPGARFYNLGGVLDDQDQPRPASLWAFSAIEPIFQAVRQRETLTTTRVQIYGHSAGAQFVHRLMMFAPPPSAQSVVVANAGWYTRPRLDVAWPYGLQGAPITTAQLQAFLSRDITILLGTADIDPQHRSLNRDPDPMLQGPHRLARGEFYVAEARQAAADLGVPFGWAKAYAPSIGHENGKMADFAAALMFAQSPDKTAP
jgi:poly(3-hydroxybutyrate) depolymerase